MGRLDGASGLWPTKRSETRTGISTPTPQHLSVTHVRDPGYIFMPSLSFSVSTLRGHLAIRCCHQWKLWAQPGCSTQQGPWGLHSSQAGVRDGVSSACITALPDRHSQALLSPFLTDQFSSIPLPPTGDFLKSPLLETTIPFLSLPWAFLGLFCLRPQSVWPEAHL